MQAKIQLYTQFLDTVTYFQVPIPSDRGKEQQAVLTFLRLGLRQQCFVCYVLCVISRTRWTSAVCTQRLRTFDVTLRFRIKMSETGQIFDTLCGNVT